MYVEKRGGKGTEWGSAEVFKK